MLSVLAAAPTPELFAGVSTGVLVVSALSAFGTFVFWVVRSLGSRLVKNEDERFDSLKKQQAESAAEVKALTMGQMQLQADVRTLTGAVDNMRSHLLEVGQHYREQMKELQGSIDKKLDEVEMRLRNDMNRQPRRSR